MPRAIRNRRPAGEFTSLLLTLRKRWGKGCGAVILQIGHDIVLTFLEAADRAVFSVALREQRSGVEPQQLF